METTEAYRRNPFALIWIVCGSLLLSSVFAIVTSCGGRKEVAATATIRYYMWGSPTVASMHRKILDIFEQEHPDVKVRLEVSNWGAYWDKLQVQMASKTEPDVYWMSGAYFFNFVGEGIFMNLASFIQRDGVELEDYFLEPDLFRDPQHLYGMPKDMTAVVLFHNKDLFDQAGLQYPDESWDWNDFLDAAQKLTKDRDGDGIIEQWGSGAFMPWLEEYIAPMVFSNGGSLLNEAKTKCLLDQPAAVEAIQFMVDLLRKHHVCVLPAQTGSVGGDAFLAGRVAMMQNISALIPEYSKVKVFQWGITPIPKSPRTGKRVTATVSLVHVINARTKNPAKAWQLVKFLSGEKAQRILAENKVFAPALKKAAREVFAVPPPDNAAEVLNAYDYGHDLQLTQNWLEWNNAVQRELEAAFLGTKSVLDACRAAARAVDRILPK